MFSDLFFGGSGLFHVILVDVFGSFPWGPKTLQSGESSEHSIHYPTYNMSLHVFFAKKMHFPAKLLENCFLITDE